MACPLSQDYNEAIQSPESSFADSELRGGHAVTGALGLPMPRSGNFADVYEFVGASGAKWAIKCFTREVPGLQERYNQIDLHLLKVQLPFMVQFQYQPGGIRIRGQWYPILKMQWVEGFLLNEFVRNNLDKPARLDGLGQIWLRMARALRKADLAHADLQHGNVILVPGSDSAQVAVKLIDYDGMWVPALANKKSGEVGHPNYQHPLRLQQGTYNGEVDRLPLLVVACALRCLVVGGKSLWDRYDNGDNLLFREADLKAPHQSALFKVLHEISDPQAQILVRQLHNSLQRKLEDAPAIDKLFPKPKTATARDPAKSPTTAVKPAEPPATSRSPLDFDGASSPELIRTDKVRRSGIPLWGLAAGGGVAALLIAVLSLAILLPKFFPGNDQGHKDKADKKDEIATIDKDKKDKGKRPAIDTDKEKDKEKDNGKNKNADKGKDADKGKEKDADKGHDTDKPKDKVPPKKDKELPRTVADWIEVLRNDKDAKMRISAAVALGQFGKASEPAIPLLVQKIQDVNENRDVRVECAMALSRIGVVPAAIAVVPLLLDVLGDPKQDAMVRERVMWSLRVHGVNLKSMNGTKDTFARILKEPLPKKTMFRYDCAYMLGMLWQSQAPDDALEVLEEFLLDGTVKIQDGTVSAVGNEKGIGDGRLMAVDALKLIGATRYAQRPGIMKQLRILADDNKVYEPLRKKAMELVQADQQGANLIELVLEKGQASRAAELSDRDPIYQGKKKHMVFLLNMEAGQTYEINMKSRAFDSYLFLEDPNRILLAQDDDGGGLLDARITWKATKTGKHRIIASHFDFKLGEFTLTIRQTDSGFLTKITKVAEGNVTFYPTLKGKKSGGELTLPLAPVATIAEYRFNVTTKKVEAGDLIEGGLKNVIFTDLPATGLSARIITENNQITTILAFVAKKKKKA